MRRRCKSRRACRWLTRPVTSPLRVLDVEILRAVVAHGQQAGRVVGEVQLVAAPLGSTSWSPSNGNVGEYR